MTAIAAEAARRGITRLCHLTPFINLVHIASGDGIRSTAQLSEDDRACFDQQDLLRLDAHPDHISCSIEYPNGWYLRQRRQNATPVQRLAPDWVCLTLDAKWLQHPETRFCVNNAARLRGGLVAEGPEAFASLYEDPVDSNRGPLTRARTRFASCPTDDQAEVLVPRHVPLADISSVLCTDDEQVKRIYYGLRQIGAPVDDLRFFVAPDLFLATRLSSLVRAGIRPSETEWRPDEPHA